MAVASAAAAPVEVSEPVQQHGPSSSMAEVTPAPTENAEPTWRRENRERLEAALAKGAKEKKQTAKQKKAAGTRLSKVSGAPAPRGKSPAKKPTKSSAQNGASKPPGKKAHAGRKAPGTQREEPSSSAMDGVDADGRAVRPPRRKGSRAGKALAALSQMIPPVCAHHTESHCPETGATLSVSLTILVCTARAVARRHRHACPAGRLLRCTGRAAA